MLHAVRVSNLVFQMTWSDQ